VHSMSRNLVGASSGRCSEGLTGHSHVPSSSRGCATSLFSHWQATLGRHLRPVASLCWAGDASSHPLKPADPASHGRWCAQPRGRRCSRRDENVFGAERAASAGKRKLPDYAVEPYIDTLASNPEALRGNRFELYCAFEA
jgi:hypothetical protein